MDLAPLLAAYPPDRPAVQSGEPPEQVAVATRALGGVTLAGGLYRVFDADSIPPWTAAAVAVFPEHANRVTVFAADWLGRLLAADSDRLDDHGLPLMLLLDGGTGETLEAPVTVEQFHTEELVHHADDVVAGRGYRTWRAASGDSTPLSLTECVGYVVPLHLGGTDDETNLERTDMDVYWSLAADLLGQTRDLPAGTVFGGVATGPDTPSRGMFGRRRR